MWIDGKYFFVFLPRFFISGICQKPPDIPAAGRAVKLPIDVSSDPKQAP